MNDVQLGRLLRLRRMRQEKRLADVATRARLGIATVSRGEHGIFASLSVARRHAAALDIRLEWHVIGRGADVARTLDEEHAAIVEVLAAWLRAAGLEVVAEASFSVYGERGRVDLLAWDQATRTIYLIEAKTEIGDLQGLLGATDVRERLAPRIASERGWVPVRRVTILALAATRHNRSVVASHRATFAEWSRATLRPGSHPTRDERQLLWVPAAAASRSTWLAGRRRVMPPPRRR